MVLTVDITNNMNYDTKKFTGHPVILPFFSGPLDLLLYLIKRDEINIHEIPISYIAEEFMLYLNVCDELNVEIAADFLVMAATLLEIKSRMLLPKPPKAENEEEDEREDPRAELVKKLLEYQQYKRTAESLREFEEEEKSKFHRADIISNIDFAKPEPGLHGNPDVLTLWQAVQELINKAERRKEEEDGREIKRPRITIRQQMLHIIKMLDESENKRVSFLSIFIEDSEKKQVLRYKIDIIVTFLAVLELMRISRIVVQQKETFGDIFIAYPKQK